MKYLIFTLIGAIEETINLLYYKAGQKNHKILLSVLTVCRGYLWYYVLKSIFFHLENSFYIVTFYIVGNVIGDWISLALEPKIDKFIVKLKSRKGRKKKRWFLKKKAQVKRSI